MKSVDRKLKTVVLVVVLVVVVGFGVAYRTSLVSWWNRITTPAAAAASPANAPS